MNALRVVLAAGVAMALQHCAQCESVNCPPSGIRLVLRPDAGLHVTAVLPSGACAAEVQCIDGASPCSTFWVVPRVEGACRVEVVFDDGTPNWVRDFEFRHGSDCCAAGLYAVDGDSRVLLPNADVSVDAAVDSGDEG